MTKQTTIVVIGSLRVNLLIMFCKLHNKKKKNKQINKKKEKKKKENKTKKKEKMKNEKNNNKKTTHTHKHLGGPLMLTDLHN